MFSVTVCEGTSIKCWCTMPIPKSSASRGLVTWAISYDLAPLAMLLVMFAVLLLLGSTAERVVQKAPCPVLTVKLPEPPES